MTADEMRAVPELSPENASTNFYWTLGKHEIFNLQTTIRGIVDPLQIAAHLETIKFALKQVVELGGQAKPVGRQPNADAAPAPITTPQMETRPVTPAPVSNGTHDAKCVMLEVGTSYTGGKPQLKFMCDGLEHPLTFTKPIGDMVRLLAPLGYTAEHLVVGKKYGTNFTVHYTEQERDGKRYKNVQSVTA